MTHDITEPDDFERMFAEAQALGLTIEQMHANLAACLDQYLARLSKDVLNTNPSHLEYTLPDIARVLARKQRMHGFLVDRQMEQRSREPRRRPAKKAASAEVPA